MTDLSAEIKNFKLPLIDLPSKALKLWATFYKAHTGLNISGGFPLLDAGQRPLGPELSRKDWCESAMEGTVVIPSENGGTVTYNTVNSNGPNQVDCKTVFPAFFKRNPSAAARLGRALFTKTDAPFGLGQKDMHLIPFRSIAVDPTTIRLGSLIFIPKARNANVTLLDGGKIVHDGYFFAADTGGDIKAAHIDIFRGIGDQNPFPGFVTSKSSGTFDAFLLTLENVDEIGVAIIKGLAALHNP
jgi:3D (Asp-Asp-Asp) domain-containing protein